MNKLTYYLIKTRTTDEPQTIFRFFEGDRSAEYLSIDYKWIPDDTLWAVFGSGDLTDDDIISEGEALRFIEKWSTQSPHNNR